MKKIYKTLIVDDEPLARQRLQKLLSNFSETIEIIGEAKNGVDAKEQINLLQPDLVFLDIEMPGLTGFELIEGLDKVPLIVFCTAYDDYSLKAFETNSIDYLVKPVRVERLEKTIEKLNQYNGSYSQKELIETIKKLSQKKQESPKTTITIKNGDKLKFVKLEEVIYFKASDKYVTLFTDTENFLTEKSLTQLETQLPEFFVRVHRAVIININFIREAQKYFNHRFIITLDNRDKNRVTTGRSYHQEVKKMMEF